MSPTTSEDALNHLANKVNDHSTVLQAMQVEMQHISKGIDRLVGVSEKQAILGNELQRHSESIDRAFKQMDAHKSDLTDAIRQVAKAFETSTGTQSVIRSEVDGFKGSIRALKWAGGIVAALLIFVGGVVLSGIKDAQTRSEAAMSDLSSSVERRKLAVDIKLESLSQQVQEVRLDRQRDVEDKQSVKP